MSQSSNSQSGEGAQDACKAKQGTYPRSKPRQNGPQTSGASLTPEEGDPAPPGSTGFVDDLDDLGIVDGPTTASTGEGPGKRERQADPGHIPNADEQPDYGSDDGRPSQKRRGGIDGDSDDDGGGRGDRGTR